MDRPGEAASPEAVRAVAFDEGNRLAASGDLDGRRGGLPPRRRAGTPRQPPPMRACSPSPAESIERGRATPIARPTTAATASAPSGSGCCSRHASDWDGAAEAWGRAEERGQALPPFDPVGWWAASGAAGRRPRRSTPVQRSAFANPVLIGAMTMLVAARRRCSWPTTPTRAAVRADPGAQGRHRQRSRAGARQRGARGRLPIGLVSDDAAGRGCPRATARS